MKKAIFLDRDGTINVDYGYVNKPKDFHIIKHSGSSLKTLQDLGYKLIVITNQSGIGRKYYTLDDFYAVNSLMKKRLCKYGIKITDVYYCPHNPDERCSCRKPSPEMVLKAAKKWNIDLKRSFFIGDKVSDILCGKNAGCKTILIKDPISKKPTIKSIVEQPDYTAKDLKECIPIISKVNTLQNKCNAAAVIPARLGSTRLHHKLLQSIDSYPLIEYTYKNIVSMGIFKDIIIATDSPLIREKAISFGAKVLMTSKNHLSGTSRISQIYKRIKADVILNIQGDEPLLSISHIDGILEYLSNSKSALCATAITPIRVIGQIASSSTVKVVKDNLNFALYFSRYPVPFERDKGSKTTKFKHLGIYGYRFDFFKLYKKFKTSSLENSEKLEQLTFLANGIPVKLIEASNDNMGIDNLKELNSFKKLVKEHSGIFKNLLDRK